jgi:hypothetical protein
VPISEGYGRKGGDWYVNSAQGCRLERVDDVFGFKSTGGGAIPLALIETLVGSADLVGKWAILSHIIEVGGYSRGTARVIMHEYPMQTTLGWIPYAWRKSLDDYLKARAEATHEGHRRRGEELNKNGPWTWSLSTAPTDPSSGSCW